ncbi:alkaline exonuclease [Lymantria xylina nucleopolyhedrovirus]|uniref:Alkaline exonuclease n=1 Tax=Lymantria xylina multiple nucleopolyhedrovirus TaxID=2847840 RepID=D4N2I7_9ABAC|nr:alkaline exonuclease [Lymantria xylina nucleopolyhedrovirus]ADD73859.1 alkaline exonuclease [Lymantria xylina nucleopolyhedrovirus]
MDVESGWTPEKREILQKYTYNAYVSRVRSTEGLSREEILHVERQTRGQSKNALWNALRLDRRTASGSSPDQHAPRQNAAMTFGLRQEEQLKLDETVVSELRDLVELTLSPARATTAVLDCGLFFSRRGLNSASPDAYFVMSTGGFVPVEIKCPFSYRDTTVEQMRSGLGARRARYRVKHTALSVNVRGPPLFAVEKTDPHYRQMQRQMYVLEAPMCVYLVKFKGSHVSVAVRRDEDFCRRENASEERLLTMYVARNLNRKRMGFYTHRLASLTTGALGDPAFSRTPEQMRALAASGLYYDYGHLVCVSCNGKFETSAPLARLTLEHRCGAGGAHELASKKFSDHAQRLRSLLKAAAPVELARQGVFCNALGALETFCCKPERVCAVTLRVVHAPECAYARLLRAYDPPAVV